MGLLMSLIAAAVHLALVALDIVAVLLIARLVCLRRPVRWISAIDRAGRPVTDGIAGAIQRWADSHMMPAPSLGRALAIGLILVLLARLGLAALCVALR